MKRYNYRCDCRCKIPVCKHSVHAACAFLHIATHFELHMLPRGSTGHVTITADYRCNYRCHQRKRRALHAACAFLHTYRYGVSNFTRLNKRDTRIPAGSSRHLPAIREKYRPVQSRAQSTTLCEGAAPHLAPTPPAPLIDAKRRRLV